MPSRKPISGSVVWPAAWAAVKKNSAVSRPSRPTASAAITTTATEPIWIASSSLPRRSLAMVRAVRRIQKIIQVTKPTAMIDRLPPSASWASNVSACWASASADGDADADRDRDARRRARPWAAPTRRPVCTRKATRMLTTSEASRPSRSPIRTLPSTDRPLVLARLLRPASTAGRVRLACWTRDAGSVAVSNRITGRPLAARSACPVRPVLVRAPSGPAPRRAPPGTPGAGPSRRPS